MMTSEGQIIPAMSRRIREEGSTAAVTHYVETRWPAIGGKDLAPLPEHAFLDPEFSEAYPAMSPMSMSPAPAIR